MSESPTPKEGEGQPPQSPFQEIEQFLEKQTGISSTDRGQRSVLIRKTNYISDPNIRGNIKQPLPLAIRVSQNFHGLGKWGEVEVSVQAPIPNPFSDQGGSSARQGLLSVLSAQEALFGYNSRNTEARIVLRRDEPFVEISFDPANALGRNMGVTERGSHLGLDKQKWRPSNKPNKYGRDLPPYTTGDDKEAAKIVGFILRAGSTTSVEKR